MNHFKEVVETVKLTTGFTKKEIGEKLGIKPNTMTLWLKEGPPNIRLPKIRMVLRSLINNKKETVRQEETFRTVDNYLQYKQEGYRDNEIAYLWDMSPRYIHQWKVRQGIKKVYIKGE